MTTVRRKTTKKVRLRLLHTKDALSERFLSITNYYRLNN